jgi:chromosome segregation ATPase
VELHKQLKNKEQEEERLVDLYQLGKYSLNKLNSRLDQLKGEREAIVQDIEDLKERSKLDTRLKTINELRVELEANIGTFDFEKKRRVLKILLLGNNGIGVFYKPDHTAEIRGLIDFAKLNEIDRLDQPVGIMNTSSS